MYDLEPGPMIFYNSPDLICIVFAAMFYANLSILFTGIIETADHYVSVKNIFSIFGFNDFAAGKYWFLYWSRTFSGYDNNFWGTTYGLFTKTIWIFYHRNCFGYYSG